MKTDLKTIWLARDRDGSLCLFWDKKPYKDEVSHAWHNNTCSVEWVDEDSLYQLSPDISPEWEDTEPVEVKVTITKA